MASYTLQDTERIKTLRDRLEEAMHEACEDGDWEAMDEAAEEVHREDFASMPCHDEGYYSSDEGDRVSPRGWGGMGGGMMGGGWGSMM